MCVYVCVYICFFPLNNLDIADRLITPQYVKHLLKNNDILLKNHNTIIHSLMPSNHAYLDLPHCHANLFQTRLQLKFTHCIWLSQLLPYCFDKIWNKLVLLTIHICFGFSLLKSSIMGTAQSCLILLRTQIYNFFFLLLV